MTKSEIGLKYIGKPRFLIGVPARDLSVAEIDKLGLDADTLVNSGLYEKPKPAARKSSKS